MKKVGDVCGICNNGKLECVDIKGEEFLQCESCLLICETEESEADMLKKKWAIEEEKAEKDESYPKMPVYWMDKFREISKNVNLDYEAKWKEFRAWGDVEERKLMARFNASREVIKNDRNR